VAPFVTTVKVTRNTVRMRMLEGMQTRPEKLPLVGLVLGV
jgi:hypothetical protein